MMPQMVRTPTVVDSGLEVLPATDAALPSMETKAARSSPVLNGVQKEDSILDSGRGSRSSSAGSRTRTPIKHVTLPSVKRRNDQKVAWTDVTGELNGHSSADPDPRLVSMNGGGDESEDSDEDSEEENRKAPDQLKLEFLDCLMNKDYDNSVKLCQMILLYEPNNPEANSFLPLIKEKQELDAQPDEEEGEGSSSGEESGSDDSDEDDDEEDDEEDTDSSDDDTSSEDTDDYSDEEEDGEKKQESMVKTFLQTKLL